MGSDYRISPLQIFEYQPPVLIDQAAPVQNTWYPFAEIINARIYAIIIGIADTGEDLECMAVIDGETIPGIGFGTAANNDSIVLKSPSGLAQAAFFSMQAHDVSAEERTGAYLIEGKSIVASIRKTTAAGVGDLRGIIMWGQKQRVN